MKTNYDANTWSVNKNAYELQHFFDEYGSNASDTEPLTNDNCDLSNADVRNYIKSLNLFEYRIQPTLLILSLLIIGLGVVSIPILSIFSSLIIILGLIFFSSFSKILKKKSIVKKSILALKSKNVFDYYCKQKEQAKVFYKNILYSDGVIYDKNGAIYSTENVFAIYSKKKKTYFETNDGDFLRFSKKISVDKQKQLLEIINPVTPNIITKIECD